MAQHLNVDSAMPPEHEHKVSRRFDANITNAAVMSPLECMKINFYFPVIDMPMIEFEERSPSELQGFVFRDPKHFGAMDTQIRIRWLASRYNMFDAKTGSYTGLDVDKSQCSTTVDHYFKVLVN